MQYVNLISQFQNIICIMCPKGSIRHFALVYNIYMFNCQPPFAIRMIFFYNDILVEEEANLNSQSICKSS